MSQALFDTSLRRYCCQLARGLTYLLHYPSMPLNTPIASLPRIQPLIAKKFALLGLQTLQDALWYFPFRHEDWRMQVQIADLTVGQDVTLDATVAHIASRHAWHRRGLSITDVTVTDQSAGKIHAVWYNLPFLAKSLKVGDRLFLSGTVTAAKSGRPELHNPVYEKPSDQPLHERLVPVYRSTEGLSQRQIRLVMKQAVTLTHLVSDPLLPAEVQAAGILTLPEALNNIHFPATPEMARQAVERLKFQELLAWHVQMLASTTASQTQTAPVIPFHETEVRTFVQHLPFTLTNDQRLAAWQTLQDLAKPQPMSRLVQGDVGSGKTVVAALVAYNAALSHFQTALVAPTVVLADQHRQTFVSMLGKHDTTVAFLTGHEAMIFSAGTSAQVTKRELLEAVASGTVEVVIGTHAILEPEVTFHNLGLVIVDEQQRFGVDQRQALLAGRTVVPHFLSLTATPIPRSFALWLGGILTISTIKGKLPGRLPIASTVYGPAERAAVDQAIQDTTSLGQQMYVITPLIEESDSLGVRAAMGEHERLAELLPHIRVGLLHGAIPASDRVAALDRFRRHELDVLVSTTVIEVGVDVPNATLIIIEGAERFGLAQLHQLRGRVGRGSIPSRCFFVTDKPDQATRQRLEQVAGLDDGFAIAELDLQERGGGDLYGQRQSGLPTWQMASLNDRQLFQHVRHFVAGQTPARLAELTVTLASFGSAAKEFHPE